MNIFIDYQHIIRPAVFVLLFIILAIAEFSHPLAKRKSSRLQQWSINLSLGVINTLSMKLLLPLLAVGAAHYASEHQIGIFNLLNLPSLVVIILSLLMLDLIIYGQHVLLHKIPFLWTLHRMHHTEIGLDVSSALRFHPIEMVLSMVIKIAFVLLLGVPVAAVILFELLLNGLALFNHSNLKLAAKLDNCLRKVIVTPDVHWIHHSHLVKETNSNYGFNLIIWDKLFSTYTAKPSVDYPQMQQG
ncbi:MAG: sterol desaturase/sphingolipid hydroxylase (fatty acid hydroxylase superfamily), partial [Psychromonas sp.]|uniref:sterol desaturase family protein n=1 Tax=Psychromonas sp. TaxID=1884585 RepID=UPI0039E4F840